MAASKLYCKIEFAWWFRWLFVPMLQTVCWANDILDIEYDETEFVIKAVKKAVKVRAVGEHDA